MKASEYTQAVDKFLADRGINFEVHAVGEAMPPWAAKTDDKTKMCWAVSLYHTGKSISFVTEFWSNDEPSAYDVLACLQKSEPEADHYEFCEAFGIAPSKQSEDTYRAVVKEYRALTKMFSEAEMNELQEIGV